MMIYDRAREKPSAVYIFEAGKGKVTALKYGPYDNGHIVVGFDTGVIAILDAIHLKKLFERQIFEADTPVQCITFDPTNLVIASTIDGEVVALAIHCIGALVPSGGKGVSLSYSGPSLCLRPGGRAWAPVDAWGCSP